MRTATATAIAALSLVAATAPSAGATVTPIQNQTPLSNLPDFSGKAWTAKKISSTAIPQNPWMAANGKSNLHGDSGRDY